MFVAHARTNIHTRKNNSTRETDKAMAADVADAFAHQQPKRTLPVVTLHIQYSTTESFS